MENLNFCNCCGCSDQEIDIFESMVLSKKIGAFDASKEQAGERSYAMISCFAALAVRLAQGMECEDPAQFDATCGDQACQIRALFIAEQLSATRSQRREAARRCRTVALTTMTLALSLRNRSKALAIRSKALAMSIGEAERAMKKEKEEAEIKRLRDRKKELRGQIRSCADEARRECLELGFSLAKRICFLGAAFLVTQTRERNQNRETYTEGFNFKLLLPRSQVPLGAANAIIDSAKTLLKELSIDFVRCRARTLSPPRPDLTPLLEPRSFQRSATAMCRELPFSPMTEVIFLSALQQKVPILLRVRAVNSPALPSSFTFSQLFAPSDSTYTPTHTPQMRRTTIVIEGFSSSPPPFTLDRLMPPTGKGLLELIDLNAAQHAQFTDGRGAESIANLSTEQLALQRGKITRAKAEGFSMDNCSRLCIDHIFCDLFGD